MILLNIFDVQKSYRFNQINVYESKTNQKRRKENLNKKKTFKIEIEKKMSFVKRRLNLTKNLFLLFSLIRRKKIVFKLST